MNSIDKVELRKKYLEELKKVIAQNKEITKINQENKTEWDKKYLESIEIEKVKYNEKHKEIIEKNKEIEVKNSNVRKDYNITRDFIIDFNKNLSHLLSFKVRIFSSIEQDIQFQNPDTIIFKDSRFKKISNFNIESEDDIQKFTQFFSNDFYMGKIIATNEVVFLTKASFGWLDSKGNQISSLAINLIDKTLKETETFLKKQEVPPPFETIKMPLIKISEFKYPEKSEFISLAQIPDPIIKEETYVGTQFDNKIIILQNGNW